MMVTTYVCHVSPPGLKVTAAAANNTTSYWHPKDEGSLVKGFHFIGPLSNHKGKSFPETPSKFPDISH